jgi:hypothetical protein
MKDPIKKLKKNKQQLDKATEKVQKFETEYLNYKKLYEEDGLIDNKEQKHLDKFAQKIAETKESIEKKGAKIQLKLEELNTFSANTTRVKGYKGKSKFTLKDENGATKKFPDKNKVSISENMEVVVLKKLSKDLSLKEIIFWEDEKYYRGYLALGALTETNTDDKVSNKNVLKAFLNDVQHTLFRVNKRLQLKKANEVDYMVNWYTEESKKGKMDKQSAQKKIAKVESDFETSTGEFVKVKQEIEADIKLIEKKEIRLDNKILKKIQTIQNNLLKLQETDVAKVILKTEKSITDAYNPKQVGGKKLKEALTVIPLTSKWFNAPESSAFLKETFNTYLNLGVISWNGDSGEVLAKGSKTAQNVITCIKVLKDNLDEIREGSEKKWIKSISISKLKQSIGLVLLQDNGINYDLSDLFASGIATLQQFATLKIIPIQTIITHEMNITNANITPTDTHIPTNEAKQAYQEVSDNVGTDLDKLQSTDPEKIDDLYQSESYLELLNVKYVLEEIKALQ